VEESPVVLVSHDDIFNYGHHSDDLMGVWAATRLANLDTTRAKLLIFDSYRTGGPGGAGRFMDVSSPDSLGPFGDYYVSWFGSVQRAADYGSSRVCFKELYLAPAKAWVWEDWSLENACAVKAPSPLWQEFARFNHASLARLYGSPTVTTIKPPRDHILHVVFLVRLGHAKSKSGARFVSNADELVQVIEKSSASITIKVTTVDFADKPFREQYLLIQSAHIFITMHGAGAMHAASMQVGTRSCCAFLELFPSPSIGFTGIWGYGNAARRAGVHYFQYQTPEGVSTNQGTVIDVKAFEKTVKKMLKVLDRRPSCINKLALDSST
jgi:hypothetical protein